MQDSGASGRLQLGVLLLTGEQVKPAGRVNTWATIREMAQMAEAVGFDSIWVEDHLVLRKDKLIQLEPGEERGRLDAWTLLGALADATQRVTIGPLVSAVSYRNPALLAKMADTVDEISGGRLLLGVGSGWHEPEYRVFGYPFDHLASRFEEALQIIAPLLKGERVTFQGKYHQVEDCILHPRGPRPGGPPIWIGARGPRMIKIAARYADAFNAAWHREPADLERPFTSLEAACAEIGRDPAEIRLTSGTRVSAPNAGEPLAPSPMALRGTAEEIAEQVWALHAPGRATHVTFSLDPLTPRGIEACGKIVEAIRTHEG